MVRPRDRLRALARGLAAMALLPSACEVDMDLGGSYRDAAPDPDPCAAAGDCAACLAADCRWCAATALCSWTAGPATCDGGWAEDEERCDDLACNAISSCDACRQDTRCAWCDLEGGVCLSAETWDCPVDYEYQSWSEACPPPNACSTHSGCESCLGEAGCGWCGDEGECYVGGWDEPFTQYCFQGWVTEDPAWSCP